MKAFTVFVRWADGRTEFFKSTRLEEARAKFNEWRGHWLSEYVSIS